MLRDQLNQKFKLMVENSGYLIYSNTPPHMKTLWAKSVDVVLILEAEYFILNERWMRFEPMTSCHIGF